MTHPRVFPQQSHPFPRAQITARWLDEIDVAGTDCHVVVHEDVIVGFAAVRGVDSTGAQPGRSVSWPCTSISLPLAAWTSRRLCPSSQRPSGLGCGSWSCSGSAAKIFSYRS